MQKLFLFILTLSSAFSFAQTYKESITLAKKYQKEGKYQEAANVYMAAFEKNGGADIDDRYQAAVVYAHLKNADTVHYHLNRLVTRVRFYDIDRIEKDTVFNFMEKDSRWQSLCNEIRQNRDKINFPLMKELEKIHNDDQSVRGRGVNNSGMTQQEMDASNLKKIEAILDKHGWLGEDEVGYKGNSALFLVIQHSELETILKYLPMLRKAVEEKKAKASQLALMEDRSNMYQNKKQVYGSQIRCNNSGADNARQCYVFPIEDPENVDKRRAAIGMNPMSEYVKSFGVEWDWKKHLEEQAEK